MIIDNNNNNNNNNNIIDVNWIRMVDNSPIRYFCFSLERSEESNLHHIVPLCWEFKWFKNDVS